VNVSSNTTVNLSNSGTGTFYSNSNCTTGAPSIQLNAGSSTTSFYFKDLPGWPAKCNAYSPWNR